MLLFLDTLPLCTFTMDVSQMELKDLLNFFHQHTDHLPPGIFAIYKKLVTSYSQNFLTYDAPSVTPKDSPLLAPEASHIQVTNTDVMPDNLPVQLPGGHTNVKSSELWCSNCSDRRKESNPYTTTELAVNGCSHRGTKHMKNKSKSWEVADQSVHILEECASENISNLSQGTISNLLHPSTQS